MGKRGAKSRTGVGEIYNEVKSEALYVFLTPTAKQCLRDRAQSDGISIQELIERLARGLL